MEIIVPDVETTACASCGMPADHLQRTALCTSCRKQFIAYPIPLWIKGFGVLLLCILLFSLFTLPGNIKTGIHYQRGKKAMEEENFLTAEKEFRKTLAEEPDYLDARCRLLVSSFYNINFPLFFQTSQALDKKPIDDVEMLGQMQKLMDKAVTYYPKDSFVTVMQQYNMQTDSIPEQVYKTYLANFPEDNFVVYNLAVVLSNNKRYAEADSLMSGLLQNDPTYYGALILKASVKREQMQLDSSHYYIRQLLEMNHEDATAMSSNVRTMLKEKKDAEALVLAKKAVELNEKNAHALASLAMAYHYNNNANARDEILLQVQKDTTALGMSTYVKDVISGKETFRN